MEEVIRYFTAEKTESIGFMGAGLLALSLSIFFIFRVKLPFYNGLSYALIAIALIQIVVGASIYFRSPKDIKRVNTIIKTDKSRLMTEEIPRMDTVLKAFKLYKWIEISLIVLGILLFIFCSRLSLWAGFGLGLSLQAGIMLILDLLAEKRGQVYLEFIQGLWIK